MTNRFKLVRFILPLLVLLLAGCSGGGGVGGVGEVSQQTVSGVAAAGAPLTGTVYLKDSSSPAHEISAPIGPDGSYSMNTSGLTGPFLLKTVGSANGKNLTLYSFAPAAGVANLNPLSHLAVVEAGGGLDLDGFYGAPDRARMLALMTALPQAVARLQTALRPTLVRFGAEAVDFIGGTFVANHQGLDLMLDMADISIANGNVIIIDKAANRTTMMPFGSFMSGSINIIDTPVGTAGTVLVLPGTASVEPGATLNLSAIVIGTSDQRVVWSVVEEGGGSITAGGAYTAPAAVGTYHVRATSVADGTKSATATLTVAKLNKLSLVHSGPGTFTLEAKDLANVGGIAITIFYAPATLANPRVTAGALTAGKITVSNTNMPGTVRWVMLSPSGISGAGHLATTTFDLPGSSPGRILGMTAEVVSVTGRPEAVVVSFTSPEGPFPPAQVDTVIPSETGPAPASTGTGTGPAPASAPTQPGATSSPAAN